LCRLDVGENAFIDEDGSTSKLALSVHLIGKNHTNFLVPLRGSSVMEGVPMETGIHHYRLEARDRENKVKYDHRGQMFSLLPHHATRRLIG